MQVVLHEVMDYKRMGIYPSKYELFVVLITTCGHIALQGVSTQEFITNILLHCIMIYVSSSILMVI